MGLKPARFQICLGNMTFFLLNLFLWNGNVYTIPVSPLHFGRRKLVWDHKFTDRDTFCPKMNLAWIYFSYEIWELELPRFRWNFGQRVNAGMIKSFEDVGIQWMYFTHRMYMIFEGVRGQTITSWIVSPQKVTLDILNFSTLECDLVWRQDLYRGNQN